MANTILYCGFCTFATVTADPVGELAAHVAAVHPGAMPAMPTPPGANS